MTDFTLSAEIEAVRDHVNFLNEWLEYNKQRPTEAAAEMQQQRNAFASVLRRLEAARWRPIEEAPRDGTRLLIARIAPTEGIERFGIEARPTHVWWAVQGSWSDKWGKWFDGVEPSGLAGPTHFMPMPEPPHE